MLPPALLMRSIGSPNWMINQDLCGGCRAVSARAMGLNITSGEDIANTNCVLLVGRNPHAADPVQWTGIKQAKQRGAHLIVIDPKRVPACDLADIWLRPRPGTDAALALAMIAVLIEEKLYDADFVERWCHGFDALRERAAQYPPAVAAELTGVPAEDIVAAARMYGQGPSCFVSGHGIDAFSAGVQTFRAYHSLLAISGNVDRSGGNRRVKTPRGFKAKRAASLLPALRGARNRHPASWSSVMLKRSAANTKIPCASTASNSRAVTSRMRRGGNARTLAMAPCNSAGSLLR